MGESVEIVLDGQRIEAFLSDNVFICDPTTIHGRMGIRAYAYSLAAGGDPAAAAALLAKYGREG